MKKITIYCLFLISVNLFAQTLSANLFAQTLRVDEKHKGIILLPSGYQIFPENRVGNNLYGVNNKLLHQFPNKTIIAAFDYEDYLLLIAKTQQDQKEIIYQNPEAKDFNFIAPKYFQFSVGTSKRLVRYQKQDIKLEEVKIPYLSAKGFIHNQKDALAFYRIVSYDPKNLDEGKEYSTFIFRISLVKDNDTTIIHTPKSFESRSAKVSLRWLDEKTLAFSLKEGVQNITIP